MIIINKIKIFFINMIQIYGTNYSLKRKTWTIILSIVFMPIYFVLLVSLTVINIALLFFYLPFYLIKLILGDTWGMDNYIMGIVLLPILILYYSAYLISFLPYLMMALLSDFIAEIISYKNHHEDYTIIWPSVFAAPHKETYPPKFTY